MEDFKKYISDVQTVTISVAKMGNQKITKSVFSQIPVGGRIRYPFKFDGIQILGYVNEKGLWVLYTVDNRLYKCSITHLAKVMNEPIEHHRLSTIEDYVSIENSELYSDPIFSELPENIQNAYRKATDRIRLFLKTMQNYQIYL